MDHAADNNFEPLLGRLRALDDGTTRLIAIDGRSASGKTTLARRIKQAMPAVRVVAMDDFYRPLRAQDRERFSAKDGYDRFFDWERLRADVLDPLKANRRSRYRVYDWNSDQLAASKVVEPATLTIVEGVYSSRPELREFYDLVVWVEAQHETRAARSRARAEHSPEMVARWAASEEWYEGNIHPQSFADVVLREVGPSKTLRGGHITHVVRVGSTVYRESHPWSATVQVLLKHLRTAGFTGGPAPLGFDDQGREKLSFIEGEAGSGQPPSYVWHDEVLVEIAKLLKQLHEASASFAPPSGAVWQATEPKPTKYEVICHNDIAPWNTIFQNGRPVAFIDWDWAGPGFRAEDIAYALWHFIPLYDDAKCVAIGAQPGLAERARRTKLFCETYGWPFGREILEAVAARQTSTLDGMQKLAAQGVDAYRILLANGAGEGILRERELVRLHIKVLSTT